MPKWKQHQIHPDLVVYLGSEDPVFLGDIDRDAESACDAHNADIDALENEIYEWKEMFHAARSDHRACQAELHKLKGLE